eukprot:1158212-Pelagomonas_calceolata.AAC.6
MHLQLNQPPHASRSKHIRDKSGEPHKWRWKIGAACPSWYRGGVDMQCLRQQQDLPGAGPAPPCMSKLCANL